MNTYIFLNLHMMSFTYSWHLVAFGFLGIGIHMDSFRFFGQYPVLYMSLIFQLVHHLTLSASLPRSRLRQLFCCLMACFTCVDVNDGLLASLISGLVTLSSAYSCPMYSIEMLDSASFFKTHVVMFVHDPRCLGSLSTIRYLPHLFMHLPCYVIICCSSQFSIS